MSRNQYAGGALYCARSTYPEQSTVRAHADVTQIRHPLTGAVNKNPGASDNMPTARLVRRAYIFTIESSGVVCGVSKTFVVRIPITNPLKDGRRCTDRRSRRKPSPTGPCYSNELCSLPSPLLIPILY